MPVRRRLPRRATAATLAALTVALAGACGDAGTELGDSTSPESSPPGPESTGPGATTTTTPPTGGTQPTQDTAATAFIGLTKDEAIALAESQGRPWRIGREDGESYPLTLDYAENRVTFEIDDGKVTAATFG